MEKEKISFLGRYTTIVLFLHGVGNGFVEGDYYASLYYNSSISTLKRAGYI